MTQKETENEFYNIYVPAPDVFEAGGSQVFSELAQDEVDTKEPNLLVIPDSYLNKLYRMKGPAVEDALKHIKTLSGKQRRSDKPVKMSLGLEAIILDEQGDETKVQDAIKQRFVQTSSERDESWKPYFMTNDSRTSIRLNRLDLNVAESQFIQVDEDIVLDGILEGNEALAQALYSNEGSIPLEDAVSLLGREVQGMDINQFVRLRGDTGTEYARVTGELERDSRGTRIVDVHEPRLEMLARREYSRKIRVGEQTREHVLGIKPRDFEQYIAMQHGLLNPDVETMFLTGSQGSGKTLLSYVCGLDQTIWWDKPIRMRRGDGEDKGGRYSHMLLLKPTDVVGGREIGFLPGDKYDKLKPHIQPYIDSHKEASRVQHVSFKELALHPQYANDYGSKRETDHFFEGAKLTPKREMFEIEHSGFIRGRSVPNTLLLIDEAQNYTPYELKTILERTGEGTKAIVMGDPYQQDNPRNTRKVNGLTHAIDQFKDKPYSMLVALSANYRSQMSEDSREWKAYPR